MKKSLLFFLAFVALLASCKEEEEMMYAKVYFPLAARADANGVFLAKFDFERDTTFIIGAYCSGSVLPEYDVSVELEPASDSLAAAQIKSATLAGYLELPADAYTADPEDMRSVIRKGTERGDITIRFHTDRLDPDKNYILPLRIKSVSHYEIAPKYNTLFFGVTKK